MNHHVFSTDRLPAFERWSAYLDMLRQHRKVECTPLGQPFLVEATFGAIPDLSVACYASGALRAVRTPALADESDDLVLYMCSEGMGRISHLGREATLSAGTAILLASSDPFVMERSAMKAVSVAIPRPLLGPMLGNLDRALMTPLPMSSPAFAFLSNYLSGLKDHSAISAPELRAMASTHVRELLAVAIGASRDAEETANGNGLRVSRLRAIKQDIRQNLATGDMSPGALAQRHRLSTRYLRKLFESEGETLSRYVQNQRLACVHRMLSDPRQVHRTVGEIAYEVGFGDLSTFNHAFRARYGLTPTELRRQRPEASKAIELPGGFELFDANKNEASAFVGPRQRELRN